MPGWANSDRKSRLPADWPRRVRLVKRRDPLCTCVGPAYGCDRHPSGLCEAPTTDVDHVIAGDDHSLENLGGLCHPCHERKTIAERPAREPRRRPAPGRHPGLPGG